MSNILTTQTNEPLAPGGVVFPRIGTRHDVDQPVSEWRSNQQFIGMLNAYRPSGGLARAPEVAAICKSRGETAVSVLADWIVKRKAVSFEWQSRIWLPLFQFNHVDMTLQPGLGDTLSELVEVYDDWEIANWFALPNPWLADCTPADTLVAAAPEVLNAARAERFVAAG
jgi:hypothetical protein